MRAREFIFETNDPRVSAMQTAMRKAGAKNADGTPLTVDGEIGPNTQAAMSSSQFARYVPRGLNLPAPTNSGPHPLPAQPAPAPAPAQPATAPQRPAFPHTLTPQQQAQNTLQPGYNSDPMGNNTGTEAPAPAGQAVVGKDGSIIIGDQKRIGGTLNWRANNPGNNMMSDMAKDFGAIGWIRADDGVKTAIFPTLEMGTRLQMAQWRTPKYNNLTIDAGCQLWATGVAQQGYGSTYARDLARAAGATIDTKVKDLTDDQLKKMCLKQGRWEGNNPNVKVVALNQTSPTNTTA